MDVFKINDDDDDDDDDDGNTKEQAEGQVQMIPRSFLIFYIIIL